MGVRARKKCGQPGCPALVSSGNCEKHRREARGTAAERGYDRRWRNARAAFLAAHPLCAECSKHGRVTPARVVDHIVPHRGDEKLFWDEKNWQSLCDFTSPYDCHGKKTGEGQ